MNSWHSFSPNGHWLVFSSKSRSPYTQMYLTHLDAGGNSSPPILIDNSTAANRAVNIPEFVNIPPDGLLKIDVPAADAYRHFDVAVDLTGRGQVEAAIAEWNKVLELDPRNAMANSNLGMVLIQQGNDEEGKAHFQKALEINPDLGGAHSNLGIVLFWEGKLDEAFPHIQRALELNPAYANSYEALVSSPSSPASPPRPVLKLEDAVPSHTEAGSLNEEREEKLKRLDAEYRRSLDVVLAAIAGSNDSLHAIVGSADSVQPGLDSPEIEKLITDLNIPRLRQLAAQEMKSDDGLAAQRQLLRVFLNTFEASKVFLSHNLYAQALTCLGIASQAAPKSPYITYDLARAQALHNRKNIALKTLQTAVDQGFSDADRVEGDRAFDGLHDNADYHQALTRMRSLKAQLEAAP
jgi:tetratricopeptide (TPR) repeat protein